MAAGTGTAGTASRASLHVTGGGRLFLDPNIGERQLGRF
jgi:hypothetical protein